MAVPPREAVAGRLRFLADEIERAHEDPVAYPMCNCKYLRVDRVQVVGRDDENEPWKLVYLWEYENRMRMAAFINKVLPLNSCLTDMRTKLEHAIADLKARSLYEIVRHCPLYKPRKGKK